MRKLVLLLAFILSPMLASANEAAGKLAQLLGDLKSYQALFVQYVADQKGTRLQETAGYIQVKRPNLFYWETQPPLAQQIVSDGKEVWIYDPDLEQVTVRKLGGDVMQTPAMLLSGKPTDLDASYQITREPAAEGAEAFRLVPKGNESLFEAMRLVFKKGLLTEMRLEDSLGQRTVISFSKIKLNPEISDDTFQFQIPEGVDVFREQ